SEADSSIYPSVRQADVILGERGLRRAGAGEILQLGELHAPAELPLLREAVQELGHPPGEALGFPDTGEGTLGVLIDLQSAFVLVKGYESLCEVMHVARGEVQALGTGGRDDVGGVA